LQKKDTWKHHQEVNSNHTSTRQKPNNEQLANCIKKHA